MVVYDQQFALEVLTVKKDLTLQLRALPVPINLTKVSGPASPAPRVTIAPLKMLTRMIIVTMLTQLLGDHTNLRFAQLEVTARKLVIAMSVRDKMAVDFVRLVSTNLRSDKPSV
jgi:hypothetical protein